MESLHNNSILYKLLISPSYQIWRHILLIGILIIITLGSNFFVYSDYISYLGNKIFFLFIPVLILYILVIYYYLYVVIPKFLLTKRMGWFSLILVILIIFLILADILIEYYTHKLLGIIPLQNSTFYPDNSIFLEVGSGFVINFIAAIGLAVPVSLKQWLTYNQQLNEVEKVHLTTEMEQLKEQVNPDFLFKILNRTGILAKTDPEQASQMLMKLSNILRYQLYDCSREKILLKTVINFISEYLSLEQLYEKKFEFHLAAQGQVNLTFVPPLLFLPFIQDTLLQFTDKETISHIIINFEVIEEKIIFTCVSDSNNLHETSRLAGIRKRLNILYKNNYKLTISKNGKTGERIIKLRLNQQHYEQKQG